MSWFYVIGQHADALICWFVDKCYSNANCTQIWLPHSHHREAMRAANTPPATLPAAPATTAILLCRLSSSFAGECRNRVSRCANSKTSRGV